MSNGVPFVIEGETFIVPSDVKNLLSSIEGWKIDGAGKAYYKRGDRKVFLAEEVVPDHVKPDLQDGEVYVFWYKDKNTKNCMPSNIKVKARRDPIASRMKRQEVENAVAMELEDRLQKKADDKHYEERHANDEYMLAYQDAPRKQEQIIPIRIELTVSVKVEK